jgi:hypothetical protein
MRDGIALRLCCLQCCNYPRIEMERRAEMMEHFGVYGYLLTGALVIGVLGVIAAIIEQKHRLRSEEQE